MFSFYLFILLKISVSRIILITAAISVGFFFMNFQLLIARCKNIKFYKTNEEPDMIYILVHKSVGSISQTNTDCHSLRFIKINIKSLKLIYRRRLPSFYSGSNSNAMKFSISAHLAEFIYPNEKIYTIDIKTGKLKKNSEALQKNYPLLVKNKELEIHRTLSEDDSEVDSIGSWELEAVPGTNRYRISAKNTEKDTDSSSYLHPTLLKRAFPIDPKEVEQKDEVILHASSEACKAKALLVSYINTNGQELWREPLGKIVSSINYIQGFRLFHMTDDNTVKIFKYRELERFLKIYSIEKNTGTKTNSTFTLHLF